MFAATRLNSPASDYIWMRTDIFAAEFSPLRNVNLRQHDHKPLKMQMNLILTLFTEPSTNL